MVRALKVSFLGISWIFAANAGASVLPPGKISLRQAFYYNFATAYFAPELVEVGGKVFVLGEKTSAAFGLKYGLQIDLSLTYSESKLTGATFLNRAPESVVSGISEIGLQITKRVYPKLASAIESVEVDVYGGTRVPGNPQHTPFDLLAINDGAVKGDLGALLSLFFHPVYVLLDLKYVKRGKPTIHDQTWVSLTVPIEVASSVQLGAFGSFVYTFGGFDAFSTDWFASQAALSTTEIPAPYVKEQYFGAGGFLALSLSEEWSIDTYGFTKVSGRNTDKGTTIGLATNYTF